MLPFHDPAVLIDMGTGDDAAVYALDDERALIATVDFFAPIVDEPYDFGRIAAANALSDIYAMGGRPLFALNLVGFPRGLLAEGALEEIVRGGAAVAGVAGIAVVGGHSIDAPEPMYGMVVIGEVQRSALTTNAGARAGDALVLTKPIGSGIIATAIKQERASAAATRIAVDVMTALNADAADVARRVGVSAATDVTGFGLLGHLHGLLLASGVAADVDAAAVPLLPEARSLAEQGAVPGGTRRNLQDLAACVTWEKSVSETTRLLLCDAQTSGGLLLALPASRAPQLLDALRDAATPAAAIIGSVTAGAAGCIRVRG